MLAPLPPPDPRPAGDDAVRLDVRVGGGRATAHPLADEFLIGGAAGCDLRLPGGLPPVVCQFSKAPDGVRVRRLSPAVPVSVNGELIAGAVPVRDGDTVRVGPAEITVSIPTGVYLTPRLVPVEDEPEPAADPTTVARRLDALRAELRQLEERKGTAEGEHLLWRRAAGRERAELDRLRAELDEQARALEEDRAIWYRRRQEIEREVERATGGSLAEADADLARREAELAAAQRELGELRQRLFDEYTGRRNQLAQLHETLAGADAAAAERREAAEADFRRRAAELEQEIADRRAAADRAAADRLRELEEEIARRRLGFEEEARAAEPRLVELAARTAELDEQRRAVEQLRTDLAADRESFEKDISWQRQQLAEREAAAAARDAELARREEQVASDRAAADRDRERHRDDLARLDRWQAALDARQRDLDARAAEVDGQLDRLRRDSGELEGHVRLADSEQARLAAEAERLAKQRAELDVETARLGERAAQLDAQQATLAVLRGKLDRQQEEMRQEAAALAVDRLRQEQARADLEGRLREAERVRAELDAARDDHAASQQAFAERNSLLSATLEDFHRQKEDLAAAEARLRAKEDELDARSADIAEQAAVLKARIAQALDLQARLEADRQAVRAREGSLSESDAARQTFQEQLRRRAEELAARSKEVDEHARRLAEDRAVFDRLRAGLDEEKALSDERLTADRQELAAQAAEVQRQAEAVTERESTLARQVGRLREVGAAVAAERKAFFEAKAAWEAERAAAAAAREQSDARFAELRGQIPSLDEAARAALDRLAAARDVLRGHLAELHEYARQTREELDAARGGLRAEAEQVRQRADELDRARAEHRAAVAGFRQQLVEWQARVAELRQALSAGETRTDQRQAELDAAAARIADTTRELERQAADLRHERQVVAEKRAEMDRHLADMREWYRRKLRELAAGRPVDESDMPAIGLGSGGRQPPGEVPEDRGADAPRSPEDEAGDERLGELLRGRGLVDDGTLAALRAEARRQRRTLRQVLLASGAATMYQLALIEAGNLDGLALGRLRVVDRVRSTPRETVYRVYDPSRPGGPTRGVYLLRHLAEAEMADAVRPDDFRQRFTAAAAAAHPNLANTLEVLDLNGRPAAVQEWVTGPASADWPPAAAVPGVWVRLLADAARGLEHAHRAGLPHGRLAPESFVLTPDGTLKLLGFGEPPWLAGGTAAADPHPAADLRALGQVAFGWSQLGSRRRGAARGKPFPNELTAVVRRLETGAEPAMGDVVAIDRPYADAGELARDLARLAEAHPCPADGWERLVRFAAEHAPSEPAAPLRASA